MNFVRRVKIRKKRYMSLKKHLSDEDKLIAFLSSLDTFKPQDFEAEDDYEVDDEEYEDLEQETEMELQAETESAAEV